MLTVDRDEEAAAAAVCVDRQFTRCDEAFLVGERERDSVLESPEGRFDAGKADDGVEHDVRRARLEERHGRLAHLHVLNPVFRGERRE